MSPVFVRLVRMCIFPALLPVTVAQAQQLLPQDRHDLATRWEHADSLRQGLWRLTPYKPVFMLPVVWSNAPNVFPYREGDPESVLTDTIPLNAAEFTFQLSFKFKAAQGLFNGRGDFWIAYSQSSRWQLYNTDLSRPFRETNYEPEFIFSFRTNYRLLGFTGRLFTLSLAHQSNGRNDPLSRSWNRIVGQIGLDRGRTTLLLRPWWRIPESAEVDENPDIQNLLGSGEFILIHQRQRHNFTVQWRSSFIEQPFYGGSVTGEWAFRLNGNLKLMLQVFQGYGESMIDYNHEQTRVGFGVSLLEWL